MDKVAEVELFVPGRVCLLGEHSDWAGGFRRFNGAIGRGVTLVCGTNQGLFARARPHPSKLILTSTDNAGGKQHCELSMDRETLLAVAREGGHWSYMAGVAFKVLEENVVGGLEIDNYMTTLPLKKGLSSSAAACVLVSRAFNQLYDLRLTTRGEMEYAYQGELLTPSQCGRLDQACAFGDTPVLMTFDGEFTSAEKVAIPDPLHLVVVDLKGAKSTTEILRALQSAYPTAVEPRHQAVHAWLGKQNEELVMEAKQLMEAGGPGMAAALGKLMSEAQRRMDEVGAAMCPEQLEAPLLHRCLEHPGLQQLVTGGKCVGAGGDGTAQLVCHNAEAQDEVARIVKRELGMDPLLLTISPANRIHTAVIPAGGFAGNLFPASQACKAELFPLFDPADGMCKPLILRTVEELLAAGIERIVLVVQPDDMSQFRRLFIEPVTPANERKLPPRQAAYARRLQDMGRHVQFVTQERQLGFGHAVWSAKPFVGGSAGGDPFLLVLGHHVYLSEPGEPGCAAQVLDAHRRLGCSVVGLKATAPDEVHKFGTVAGSWVAGETGTLRLSCVVEKPSAAFARDNLQVEGTDQFLTIFGMYALDAAIMDILEEAVVGDRRDAKGDIPFTPALDALGKRSGLSGIVVSGERLAVHDPASQIEANRRLLALRQPCDR